MQETVPYQSTAETEAHQKKKKGHLVLSQSLLFATYRLSWIRKENSTVSVTFVQGTQRSTIKYFISW